MKWIDQTTPTDAENYIVRGKVRFEPGDLAGKSAGELRALKITGIPDDVPDCAVLSGKTGAFEWIEVDVTLNPKVEASTKQETRMPENLDHALLPSVLLEKMREEIRAGVLLPLVYRTPALTAALEDTMSPLSHVIEACALVAHRSSMAADDDDCKAGCLEHQTCRLWTALRESVKLQSHYAHLLNSYDGGRRLKFEDAEAWIARLVSIQGLEDAPGEELDPNA